MYSFYFYYFACGRQVVNSPLVSFDRGLVVFILRWFLDPILLSDASGPRGLEVRGHGTGSAFLVDFHDGRSTGHGGHYPTGAHFVRRSHSDRYQTVGNCCRSPGQRSRISRRYSAVYRLIHFNVWFSFKTTTKNSFFFDSLPSFIFYLLCYNPLVKYFPSAAVSYTIMFECIRVYKIASGWWIINIILKIQIIPFFARPTRCRSPPPPPPHRPCFIHLTFARAFIIMI